MAILTEFETDGIWRIVPSGLVYKWGDQTEYVPTELDVPFKWNPEYNFGIHPDEQVKFKPKYRIQNIIEIVEVFREPFNDVDASFKGRSLLVASFVNETDAIYFKMAMSQF